MKPILLVEDVDEDAELVQAVLEEVRIANPMVVVGDGLEAIDYLKGEGAFADHEKFPLPGILLLDLKMPRLGGFEVLEWLKERPELKDLVIVVLSGRKEPWEVSRAYALGASSFLLKPCQSDDILNLARTHPEHWTLAQPV